MTNKTIAALGIGANALFWASLFGFAALRPDYSHFTKAVSELGVWGAPNMWAFNVLSLILPGLLLAAFGWTFARRVAQGNWLLAFLLPLGGVGLAIAGLFPGDMRHMQSLTTTGHLIGAMGSLLFWLLALIALAISVRRSWTALAIVSLAAVVAAIATFFLYGAPHAVTRAIVQRMMFAEFFAWYAAVSLMLLNRRA